jgi:hypothetical protein
MWCKSCRQDVPGLVDVVDGRYGCPRCGAVLLSDAGIDLTHDVAAQRKPSWAEAVAEDAAASAVAPPPPNPEVPEFEPVRPPKSEPSHVTTLRWDAANWELNEKLRHVERVTAATRRRYDAPVAADSVPRPHAVWRPPVAQSIPPTAAATSVPSALPHYHSFPTPNAYAAPPYPSNPFAPAPYPAPQPPPPEPYEHNSTVGETGRLLASLISWLFIGGAITAFSCGGFLAAWGAVAERAGLQQLGMPIVIVGVALLVVGVLPQLFLRRHEEQQALRTADHAAPHFAPSTPHYERHRAAARQGR